MDARSDEATERYPVDIHVRQFGRMIAFQLPSREKSQGWHQVEHFRTNIRSMLWNFNLFQEDIVYSRHERSMDLCPLNDLNNRITGNSTVTISISTYSKKEVDVSIKVRIKERGIDWSKNKDKKYVDFRKHFNFGNL